ncbi:MAG: hypothetical protein HDS41_07085 [Bacteroides sp.]|nr:hypothetical protein [Bacteroides sp.]
MRNVIYAGMIALCSVAFAACSDDDDKKTSNPDSPEISEGVFIINQGNMVNKIDGSLSYIDLNTQQVSQDVFFKANNRKIGDTPQAAVVYGSKIYMGVYLSNTIEILDRKTLKVEKTISLTGAEGQNPRSLVAKDGNVYISMYNGYVSRLDTLSLSIDKTVKVGPNPDIIAILGNNLYVPNSDGMNWEVGYGTTASCIDLSTFTVIETFTVPLNPERFLSNGREIFLLAKGDYGMTVTSKVYKMNSDKSFTEIAEATHAAIWGNFLYYVNAPYMAPSFDYKVYDIKSETKHDMLKETPGADVPAGMGVNPITGNIYITLYTNGYNGYDLPGYCNEYDAQGNFVKKYTVGVCPEGIFFNYE